MKSYWLGLLLIWNTSPFVNAQQTTLSVKIDKEANELVNTRQVQGITILLLKDGKTYYNKAFGFADAEGKSILRTDHIFRIASQTKAVTSIAAMMLWEEGRFLLDDPVSKYIPVFSQTRVLDQFNAADSGYTTVATSREITIRDLLRHTSGISYPVFSQDARLNAIYAKAGVATGIGSKGNLKEKVLLLAKQPLAHQPGTAFTYGLNTDVLGYLIEIWSGMQLDVFIQQRILEPLGMKDTYFRLPESKKNRLVKLIQKDKNGKYENVLTPVFEGNNPEYPLSDSIYLSGGAGLVSTTADYARFLQMLLNKGVSNGKRLIAANTLEMVLSNQLKAPVTGTGPLQFGLGLALVNADNKYMHAENAGSFYWGGIFNTHYWVDPKEHIIGLVYTQEYNAYSENLGILFRNIIYSSLSNNKK